MILNKICNSIGNNVTPKKFEKLHGINPRLSYNKANFFYLPRFSTPEMIEARKMNKIALRDIDCFYDKSFKNATYKDYLVLKDNTVESNFTRVRWVNPRDRKSFRLKLTAVAVGLSTNKAFVSISLSAVDGLFVVSKLTAAAVDLLSTSCHSS